MRSVGRSVAPRTTAIASIRASSNIWSHDTIWPLAKTCGSREESERTAYESSKNRHPTEAEPYIRLWAETQKIGYTVINQNLFFSARYVRSARYCSSLTVSIIRIILTYGHVVTHFLQCMDTICACFGLRSGR